jgi:hypothetical protein
MSFAHSAARDGAVERHDGGERRLVHGVRPIEVDSLQTVEIEQIDVPILARSTNDRIDREPPMPRCVATLV